MFSASAALSVSVTALGRGAAAGDFFENIGNWRSLGRPAITSAAARITRCARLPTSARVSFPPFGATSDPTKAPNPSPAKKLFRAASRHSFTGLAVLFRAESAYQRALAECEPELHREYQVPYAAFISRSIARFLLSNNAIFRDLHSQSPSSPPLR